MPIVQFHLIEDHYPKASVAALLREASVFYVETLYPSVTPPPIDRVRAFVTPVPAWHWATGGVLVAEGGMAAPYFTCLALTGRPVEQLQALMAGFTDLIARHLGSDRKVIRGTVSQIDPALWSIGGVPASEARATERNRDAR